MEFAGNVFSIWYDWQVGAVLIAYPVAKGKGIRNCS
jgi:hypothetical protein